jgi:hypothetical protein
VCSWRDFGMLWRLWHTTLLWNPTQSAEWWSRVQHCSLTARTARFFCSGTKLQVHWSTNFISRNQKLLVSGIQREIRQVRLNFVLQHHGSPVSFWPVKFSKIKLAVSHYYSDRDRRLAEETKKGLCSCHSTYTVCPLASSAKFFTDPKLTNYLFDR